MNKRGNIKKTLKYYWEASRPHKWIVFTILLLVLINAVIDVVIPMYFRDFFNILSGAEDYPEGVAVRMLFSVLITIAVFSFARWFFWRINNFLTIYFQSKGLADLANRCFAYLHKHSFSYFSNTFVGSLVKKVNWFVRAFESVTDQIIYRILPLIVTLGMIVFVLIGINVWLGIGVLVWSLVFITIAWLFSRYKLKYDIKRNEAESLTSGLLADTIANHLNVKLFNGYQREVDTFEKSTRDLDKARRFTWNLGSIFEGTQGFLALLLEIGVLLIAINLWQKNVLSVGDFVMIQFYIFNVVERVWSFNRVLRVVYERLSDAEEMTAILETPHEIKDVLQAKELKVSKGKIEFAEAVFNYSKTRKVIDKMNLVIPSKQRLAIIGSSGAGKTTIAKLLFRTHDLTGGKILIDGQDISKVTQESLWRNVGLVPQDPILFHRSLKENICYGKPDATDEEIVTAAKMANCHDFITSLDLGYEAFVGERGIKLSGGERQRVSIARAILKNAPILVLDEATSSLDSESEILIQGALEKLMKDKTVIVIAHRLSTIQKMDRIIVVEEGEIIEDGSHKELIKKEKGIYYKLWRLQAGGFSR